MILATAYNAETGEILRAITASSKKDLMLNVLEHESLIEGSFDPEYFYIKNEHPKSYTLEKFINDCCNTITNKIRSFRTFWS